MFLDRPRGLGDAELLEQRREMLTTVAAVQPLREWIQLWQERRPGSVCPDFDPAEAGVAARVLVLLEAPGPTAHTENGTRRPGTGFISVDNPDQTAANSWAARREAGLGQDVALHWNIVPWYLGPASTKPTAAAVAEGADALRTLLPLLPDLRVVVLAGRYAQKGWDKHWPPPASGCRCCASRIPHLWPWLRPADARSCKPGCTGRGSSWTQRTPMRMDLSRRHYPRTPDHAASTAGAVIAS